MKYLEINFSSGELEVTAESFNQVLFSAVSFREEEISFYCLWLILLHIDISNNGFSFWVKYED